jgi:hypothetical protein
VLAEFGNAEEQPLIGFLVKEDGVVNFLLGLALGPFLAKRGVTLWPAFFCEAAFMMFSFDFFCPATGCLP